MKSRKTIGRNLLSRLAARLRRRIRKGPEDAPEVHEARVAARRLRAAAELWTAGPERLVRALKRWHRRWGRIRDLDVALERLGALEGRVSGIGHLKRFLQERRLRKARAFRRWASRSRRRKLLRLLEEVPRRAENRPEERLRSEALRTAAAVSELARSAEALSDPRVTHELRREVRRLRYLLEFAGIRRAEDLVGRLERVQRMGGDWRDWAVLEREAGRAEAHGRGVGPLGQVRRRFGRGGRERARRFVKAARALGDLRNAVERIFR